MEAICFAVFVPFFFVMSGVKLDLHGLLNSARSFMLVPVFLTMFVVVRGTPVLLYRSQLRNQERLPFALYSSTPTADDRRYHRDRSPLEHHANRNRDRPDRCRSAIGRAVPCDRGCDASAAGPV
jgi:hypothetical protein